MFKRVKKYITKREMENSIKYYASYERTRYYFLWIPIYTSWECTGRERSLFQ